MNRILVPVYPRSDYQNLLQYVTSVATRSHAELHFLILGASSRDLRDTQRIATAEDLKHIISFRLPSRTKALLQAAADQLLPAGISFQVRLSPGSVQDIIHETERQPYDLLAISAGDTPGIRHFLRNTVPARLISGTKVPVFVVPRESRYNEIRHITYAVDLTDYDPSIIQQVKHIASLFDAKLTIAHVNTDHAEQDREQYQISLERTITDTLDYPKVFYKFFDHADPFGGIKHFVSLNNSNLLAMINRKAFSWRELFFKPTSLTRKMVQEIRVPILAFRK